VVGHEVLLLGTAVGFPEDGALDGFKEGKGATDGKVEGIFDGVRVVTGAVVTGTIVGDWVVFTGPADGTIFGTPDGWMEGTKVL